MEYKYISIFYASVHSVIDQVVEIRPLEDMGVNILYSE